MMIMKAPPTNKLSEESYMWRISENDMIASHYLAFTVMILLIHQDDLHKVEEEETVLRQATMNNYN